MAKINKKKNYGNNPFAEYQKRRKEETLTRVKGAIARIREVKGKVGYRVVAKIAGRTEMAIRHNKEAALLIEQAMAEQRGSVVPLLDHRTVMPQNLDDCHTLIRLLRADNKELGKQIAAYQAHIKHYNLAPDGSNDPARAAQSNLYEAALSVILAILEDKIYKLTPDGVRTQSGKLVVPKSQCEAAELYRKSQGA
jgi:hypothetical protein